MYQYFKVSEFDCSETGENEMEPRFLQLLDSLRKDCGFAFHVNSGYRSPDHSIEAAKPNGPGRHAEGIAADIKVTNGWQRYRLVEKAIEHGFNGIGVAKTYVHLDIRAEGPVMWVY